MGKLDNKKKSGGFQQSKKHGGPKFGAKNTGAGGKKVSKESKVISKPTNPFEVKVNKQKFNVLGRPTKHERGLPGVSRAKALKKRHETLLVEYKNRLKSNKLVDRRLGEKDPNMSVEAKMEMRFLAQKIKSHNKKSKFLLGDDEVLTHRGTTLADIEKFDDPRSDSEDEDDKRLGKDFVSDAHFGGGFLKKSEETEETRQNRESLIDNMIAESKKRKEERQKEKEETDDLTEKLDMDFKDVLDVLVGSKNPPKSDAPPAKLPDSAYDLLVRELRFDARGKPADKLKSADELARIEKEKLERLEAERLKRMRGDSETTKKIPHRSADDLDDGFAYYEPQMEEKPLSYSLNADVADVCAPSAEENEAEGSAEEDEGEEEASDEEESDDEDDDNYSDLATSDEEEAEDEEEKPKAKKATPVKKKESKSEIPFVFKVPEEYEEFLELMQSYSEKQQRTVLQRMIKCNHPALDGSNKSRVEKLFAFLMQYVHDVSIGSNLGLLNEITPAAFDLAQIVPSSHAASTLLDVLMEKREEFASKGKKRPVSIATVIFLKLTALIFPASDFRHPVTTPAAHLLLEGLLCPVNNLEVVSIGLGLCAIAYEFVSLSKRFIPEVIHFLHGLVQIATPRPPTVAARGLVFPFRPVGAESQLLVLTEEGTQTLPVERIRLTETEFNDRFRVAALNTAVKLLTDFLSLWNTLPAVVEVYGPIGRNLQSVPLERYPESVGESAKTLMKNIEDLEKLTRKRLLHETKKPKALRLYEPSFEEKFDGRKKRVGSKEKLERDKLQHKLKREMKGAIREIRKDNAFIAREKLKEKIGRDNERKRKVKELLGSLATQEGEIRRMKKGKQK